jgi:hypothetical protein
LLVFASTTSDIVVAVAGLVGTLATAYFAYLGQKFVRDATVANRAAKEGSAAQPNIGERPPVAASLPKEPIVDREIEGYIVRFILFSLSASAWGALVNIANPFILFSGPLATIVIGGIFTMIFLLLGMPLLVDIVRRYGIRARVHARS